MEHPHGSLGMLLVVLMEEPGSSAERSEEGRVCKGRKGEMFSCEVNNLITDLVNGVWIFFSLR